MRLALRSDASACGLRPSAGKAGLLRSMAAAGCLAATLLFPHFAVASRGPAHPPPNVTHMIVPSPPAPNEEKAHQKLVDGEQAQQQAIQQGAEQTLRNAPPPPKLDGEEPKADDPVDLIVYYGVLALLTLAGVSVLYRYLAFRFSLDSGPEAPGQDASEHDPVPQAQPAVVRADPRPAQSRPAAQPAPLPPRAVPQLAPQGSPKVEVAAPQMPRPAASADFAGRASKVLSATDGWLTIGGIAQAIQADESTTAKVLDNLVDSGRVQEAKAQNGQTVYRYTR